MFSFDDTWARELEGTYVAWTPDVPPHPELVVFDAHVAASLGLDADALRPHAARWLSGAEVPDGARPLAQAYAGHQFGNLSPQLGDGRAVLLGELHDAHGRRVDLQLKGSGRTPFSRGGDGKATLGPMLREHLMGEAMHALGVPTTRALAVTRTGETIRRDGPQPGAVLARVASSHLRVGTFEFFALRRDVETLRRVAAYALRRHAPEADAGEPALALLDHAVSVQARLVARWMDVGFIHGVLNTDNVTISGETLDFGPCAFLERHDPRAVFSSIDHQGRYAYGNQPGILAWDLARLGSALVPLLGDDPQDGVPRLQAVLDRFEGRYRDAWIARLRAKLGLTSARDGDRALLSDLEALLRAHQPDHTRFFRRLADALRGEAGPLFALVDDPEPLRAWVSRWTARVAHDGDVRARAEAMDAVNPWLIPRNHRVEEALSAAVAGDLAPYTRLVEALRDPFSARDADADLAEPAPAGFTEGYQTFCGT